LKNPSGGGGGPGPRGQKTASYEVDGGWGPRKSGQGGAESRAHGPTEISEVSSRTEKSKAGVRKKGTQKQECGRSCKALGPRPQELAAPQKEILGGIPPANQEREPKKKTPCNRVTKGHNCPSVCELKIFKGCEKRKRPRKGSTRRKVVKKPHAGSESKTAGPPAGKGGTSWISGCW